MTIQKTPVVAALALFCCLLWGSAFPCFKIGYEWFAIEGAGSQMLFAGWRFFCAGAMTFFLFSFKEGKPLRMKKSSIPFIFGQGVLQTTIQYFFFYLGLANTTGAKGSIITASNAFFAIIIAHFLMKEERCKHGDDKADLKKGKTGDHNCIPADDGRCDSDSHGLSGGRDHGRVYAQVGMLVFLSGVSVHDFFYHLGDSAEAQPSWQGGALWFYHSGIRNCFVGTAAPRKHFDVEQPGGAAPG